LGWVKEGLRPYALHKVVILRACDFSATEAVVPKERVVPKEGCCRKKTAPNAQQPRYPLAAALSLSTTLSFLSFRAKPRNLRCAIRMPQI
jgi:hypothetical protein